MKRLTAILSVLALLLCLNACGNTEEESAGDGNTLVYASGDYTRINPALDEHGEINLLLFDGLTAHDGKNQVIPGLAESWETDPASCTYTFHLREGVRWHDGRPVTAEDVQFTIEAVMDPENASENAADFEDVREITVPDERTVVFRLSAPNAAFLEYMSMPVLPKHLLEGEDFQTSGFFRNPTGTGPYRLERWEEGQAMILVRNDDYYKGPAKIQRIIFKIVPDDSAKALQMQSGELDLALLAPRDAERFRNQEGYAVYPMTTSDYRGILFNFHHPFWQENRDLIPAVCCALDRQKILDAAVLGHGETAYGPLQRNEYNNPAVERYDYDPQRTERILQDAGCEKGGDGFYYRNGEKIGFVISVAAGDQVRLDMAQASAQQLRAAGIDCTVEIPAVVDWAGQMAYLIGWGSPFDADDHTYKVFGTGKGANYSGYSNPQADQYLLEARETDDPEQRKEAYAKFQEVLAADPAFAFLCYVDADYVSTDRLQGIDRDTVLGHHGTGIFWNVTEWTLQE